MLVISLVNDFNDRYDGDIMGLFDKIIDSYNSLTDVHNRLRK